MKSFIILSCVFALCAAQFDPSMLTEDEMAKAQECIDASATTMETLENECMDIDGSYSKLCGCFGYCISQKFGVLNADESPNTQLMAEMGVDMAGRMGIDLEVPDVKAIIDKCFDEVKVAEGEEDRNCKIAFDMGKCAFAGIMDLLGM